MKNKYVLIGYMGCGKSTVGRKLALRLGVPFYDTDDEIEKEQGMSISEIFTKFGEERFRSMETTCLIKLLEKADRAVISVGGGLPLKVDNQKALKQFAICYYLKALPETICKRLKNDTTRPLLAGDHPELKVQKMLNERQPIYEKCADFKVTVDERSYEDILQEIICGLGVVE